MLKRIRLRNFKSFSDQTIELDRLTIILGPNGAGKSNFFDALRLLKSIGEGRSVRDALQGHSVPGGGIAAISGIRGGAQSLAHFDSKDPTVEISLEMEVQGNRIEYAIAINPQTYRVVREQLKSDAHPGPYAYSTYPDVNPLVQDADGVVLKARFYKKSKGPNPSRDFSPSDFILTQFTSRKAESKVNEELAIQVRQELSSISPLELRPEVLRQYSALGQFEMGEHGEDFAGAVWEMKMRAADGIPLRGLGTRDPQEIRIDAQQRMKAILSWLSEITPRPISDLTVQHAPTGESIVAMVEQPYSKPVSAPSLSDGTLRFAALALAALGGEPPRTLCIEEIENGINPSRVSLLIRMMEQLTAADEGTQVIASTHSSAVLNSADTSTLSSCIAIGWDGDTLESRAKRLIDLPGFSQLREKGMAVGDLQEEGWINEAASL